MTVRERRYQNPCDIGRASLSARRIVARIDFHNPSGLVNNLRLVIAQAIQLVRDLVETALADNNTD